MQSAVERRQAILEYINDHRHVLMQELIDQFGVCRRTIVNDVRILACSYPIYTQTTGAGGVFAMEGWYLSRRYLRDDQEALLRRLLPGLQPEDQKTMQSLLDAFAKPHKEDRR